MRLSDVLCRIREYKTATSFGNLITSFSAAASAIFVLSSSGSSVEMMLKWNNYPTYPFDREMLLELQSCGAVLARISAHSAVFTCSNLETLHLD